ncbi:hypothetical protein [Pseudarthrobacter sp. S9]|uniref:hypothetical protein n=1 Tax=Pseudarthrobacter sp. S9 TaxID=3418421 RepID=UPI003D05ECA3
MTTTPKDRVREILSGLFGGSTSHAVDALDEEFIFIARNDFPTVQHSPTDKNTYLVGDDHIIFTSIKEARVTAMQDLAVWQFMTAEHDAQYKRLDDLAAEFSGRPDAEFVKQPASTQLAILKIIELEADK